MAAEGRRLAEAQRSIEALTAAAGADKESTIAALQARTFCFMYLDAGIERIAVLVGSIAG
jgi:hypothetical protein